MNVNVICRGFNFSRWRWPAITLYYGRSNGRTDEKGVTRIKRALSMVPWFSAPRDLYFCTRPHVTLIHLILRVYRILGVSARIYARISCIRRMHADVRTCPYIPRPTFRHYRRRVRRAPWFQNILPFLVEFLIFRVLTAPFLPSGRLLPRSAIFCTFSLLANSPRATPFYQPAKITRYRVCVTCMKFAYF